MATICVLGAAALSRFIARNEDTTAWAVARRGFVRPRSPRLIIRDAARRFWTAVKEVGW